MKHWTEESIDNFRYRIAFDFIEDLQSRMQKKKLSQAAMAKMIKISEGRVSQVFNNPGNLTIDTMIEFARALDTKIAIVTYDDGDPNNKQGPVPSEIFRLCWENCGSPLNIWDVGSEEGTVPRIVLQPTKKSSIEETCGKTIRYQEGTAGSKKSDRELQLAA